MPAEDDIEDNLYERYQNLVEIKSYSQETSLTFFKSCCINCEGSIDITAFLCNHYCCKICLSIYCCQEIISYCNNVNNSIGANIKFSFHCFYCGDFFGVPTRMVIKYYLEKSGAVLDPQTKAYWNLILKNYIPFFDGVLVESSFWIKFS